MGRATPPTKRAVALLRRAYITGDRAIDPQALVRVLPRSASACMELHDLLLFFEAYPSSPELHAAARSALASFKQRCQERAQQEPRFSQSLRDTGLPGSETVGLYSFTLVRWMLVHWPEAATLFSVDAPVEEVLELLRPLLPAAEREALDLRDGDAATLMAALFGGDAGQQLRGLVGLIQAHPATGGLREALFARLQVYIRINGVFPSLTDLRGPEHPSFIHDRGLERGVDLRTVVEQPVGPPMRLSTPDRRQLIEDARAILCLMQRETDPITYAREAECFAMGRGLVIALFHLAVAHRLPFDSYVGFMAFKNGVPLAYGGAWIFPGTSKVGINVFPALRGGESAWFFAQLLRLYRQRFGVDRFEAENYQLGHNNADGLKSGAYWFYYRLGFRPTTKALQRIAEREFKKLSSRKGYQVPLKRLKQLVEQGLELVITESDGPLIDTAALTMAVQRHVVERYKGDRQRAIRGALERLGKALPLGDLADWSPEERTALYLWALPLDMVEGLERWPARERKRLVAMIKAKGAATETAHQASLNRHRRVQEAWHRLARM